MPDDFRFLSGVDLLDAQALVEATERWIRVQFNGVFVADSRDAVLLRERSGNLAYYFPEKDVKMKHLVPGRASDDGRRYFDVRVGNKAAKSGVWQFTDPPPDLDILRGSYSFHWNRMDHWYEEEDEVIAHPRDPYHRVDVRRSSREIKIEVDGVLLAQSSKPVIVFETGLPTRYYLPPKDVRSEYLESSPVKTLCPYKGQASYWTVSLPSGRYNNLVWCYEEPLPEMQPIKGLLCFFNERVDLIADGVPQERPVTKWS